MCWVREQILFLYEVGFFVSFFPVEYWAVKKGAAFQDSSVDVWRSRNTLYPLEDYGHRATSFH